MAERIRKSYDANLCDIQGVDFIGAQRAYNSNKWTYVVVKNFPDNRVDDVTVYFHTSMGSFLNGGSGRPAKMNYLSFMKRYVWKNLDGSPQDHHLAESMYICTRVVLDV